MKCVPVFVGLSMLFTAPLLVVADDTVSLDELVVVRPSDNEDVPMGQGDGGDVSLLPEEGGTGGDLFGDEGGFFHPYLSLQQTFTDNVFNVGSDEESGSVFTISPGFWVSMPRKKEVPVTIAANNTSAGGLQQQIADYGGTDRYLVYALAGADINMYSTDSDLNSENFSLELLGRYNMASGLSLQLLDSFSKDRDSFDEDSLDNDNFYEFSSNLVMATADWDLTEKLRFKVDYSNFLLRYDDSVNSFLERDDNVIDLYGYYKYSPKTSIFLQYRYTNVEYDSNSVTDNTQHSYYGGVRWDTTEKLSLLFKIGSQNKEFDTTTVGYDDSDTFAVDLQAQYQVTEKTEIIVNIYRQTEESDNIDSSDKVVSGLRLGYNQEITEKITVKADFVYENSDYSLVGGGSIDEDSYYFRPAVQYLFKDWLMAEAAYTFDKVESSDDVADYDTNLFAVSLNFAL